MLKYKVRLTENDFKDNNIVWREKYVAPDLSYFSGVTDSIYHLERYNNIQLLVQSQIRIQSLMLTQKLSQELDILSQGEKNTQLKVLILVEVLNTM